jgi:hypothetical protein
MASNAPVRTAARPLAPSAPGVPLARRVPPSGRLVAAVALVALIGTGCSNAPAAATGGAGGAQNGPGGTPSPAELEKLRKERGEFAKCVRENGVEDFPDPDANAIIIYNGDDPDMKSASEKCDTRPPGERGGETGSGG